MLQGKAVALSTDRLRRVMIWAVVAVAVWGTFLEAGPAILDRRLDKVVFYALGSFVLMLIAWFVEIVKAKEDAGTF